MEIKNDLISTKIVSKGNGKYDFVEFNKDGKLYEEKDISFKEAVLIDLKTIKEKLNCLNEKFKNHKHVGNLGAITSAPIDEEKKSK